MRVEKEKRKVNIMLQDGCVLKGVVHINPGERTLDFINDANEIFIAVTEVKFSKNIIVANWVSKRNTIILNKSAIKWVEEI